MTHFRSFSTQFNPRVKCVYGCSSLNTASGLKSHVSSLSSFHPFIDVTKTYDHSMNQNTYLSLVRLASCRNPHVQRLGEFSWTFVLSLPWSWMPRDPLRFEAIKPFSSAPDVSSSSCHPVPTILALHAITSMRLSAVYVSLLSVLSFFGVSASPIQENEAATFEKRAVSTGEDFKILSHFAIY